MHLTLGVLLGMHTKGSGRVSRPKGHQIWERGDGFGRVGMGMRVERSRIVMGQGCVWGGRAMIDSPKLRTSAYEQRS